MYKKKEINFGSPLLCWALCPGMCILKRIHSSPSKMSNNNEVDRPSRMAKQGGLRH